MFNVGIGGGMVGQGQVAAGGKGGSGDPKATLNWMCQKANQRPLTKEDIVFTTNKFNNQYQAIAKLVCLDGKEYAGHLCATPKEAEKSAAEQAVVSNSELMARVQNMPKQATQKRAAGAAPAQPAAKKPKVKAEAGLNLNLPHKMDLNNVLNKVLGRPLTKGEAKYISNPIGATGQYQATVQIASLPGDMSGKAWAGELKPTKAEAEQSAAEQAAKDLQSIVPAETAVASEKTEKTNKKKKKKTGKSGNKEEAMQQMAELVSSWTDEVSKQEGEQDLATKTMMWMLNGQQGPPPRDIVAAEPVTGTVAKWTAQKKNGYLKPDAPLNHEGEAYREGKVWVGKKDLVAGLDELVEGMKVSFKVYYDTQGLGAEEVAAV